VKFQKRPVVVEAEQYNGPESFHIDDFNTPPMPSGVQLYTDDDNRVRPMILTLEGKMRVSPGDWIITGVRGEKYPCKPDIFEATYERVTP
jgi:hypothetical protein